jgi:hypothetical protein
MLRLEVAVMKHLFDMPLTKIIEVSHKWRHSIFDAPLFRNSIITFS